MKKLLYTALISILLISCKTQNNETELKTKEALKELTFNQGKPWKANQETHIGVTKMDALIKKFNTSKSTEFSALGEALSKQTSYIIKNCDMKGEPHDQLHVVLVPMLDEISLLREDLEENLKTEALLRLEIYINTYFEYFNK